MHATTWRHLQETMLSEKSQPQKTDYHMILFITFLQNKITEMRNMLAVARGQGWGLGGEVGVAQRRATCLLIQRSMLFLGLPPLTQLSPG